MSNGDDIISGFDDAAGNEVPFAVDFSTATRLNASGSTCDVYECTVQRRRVFVKRLKAEYRDNPLYRAAFDKEYDLGVSLSHPSLPRYVGFGGDYIVMDFVEGETLAELIDRNDKRLKNKRFVGRLLSDLIGVVEYLHNRNIVHCDIKSDNIIVSPYSDRPATLVDFDKAYSPWLDSTHGNTSKYGCDGCADGSVDFKGIGLIAARLGMKRLADACASLDVSADSLLAILHGRKHALWWILGGCGVAGVLAAIAIMPHVTPAHEDSPARSDSTTIVETAAEAIPAPPPETAAEPAIDKMWISALISETSDRIKERRLRLFEILDCDTVSIADKRNAISDYSRYSADNIGRIIFSAVSRYGHLSELDVQNAVRRDSAWIRLNEDEMELTVSLMNWKPEESPRPINHPASQPDTAPGGTRPAPRR